MSQNLASLWAEYGAGGAVILSVALCGFLIVFHEMRTQRAASIHIANWMWDAARVDQFLWWRRAGLTGDDWRENPDVASKSGIGVREVSEADMILFDTLELRHLQAKEFEAILHGQKSDKSLLKAVKVIEASIGRRRWRMSNNLPTPGLVRSTADRGTARDVRFSSDEGERDYTQGRSALDRLDQNSNTDSELPLVDVSAAIETGTSDELLGGAYMQAFGAHLAGIANSRTGVFRRGVALQHGHGDQ